MQGFAMWLLAACRSLLHKSDVWMDSSSDFLSYLQETYLFPYVDGSKADKLLKSLLA